MIVSLIYVYFNFIELVKYGNNWLFHWYSVWGGKYSLKQTESIVKEITKQFKLKAKSFK